MKIAIIGAGIAGNVVARRLYREHDITLYEAGLHVGGHSDTHEIELEGERQAIDTGFIVFNERTYPNFTALLREIGVASQPSSMSFSVRDERTGLEYSGTSIDTLFAQRRNLVRSSFHRMTRDILRFNREAPALLEHELDTGILLGAYLREGGYSAQFIDQYLIPMGAAIWSTDPQRMLGFPARYFVRFFHNHGMLSVGGRPQWLTVCGGSARYVEKLVAPFRHRIELGAPVVSVRRHANGVQVAVRGQGARHFDYAFVACHSDQALQMLEDPSRAEREVLTAIPYQKNDAVLHSDERLLPQSRRAWAAWNYHVLPGTRTKVALTYNMNILQQLPSRRTFCVTLNRTDAIDPARILRRLTYHHPLFTTAGVAAQRRQREINGANRTFYCGAYWGFGFHEDGVVSALSALRHFDETIHAQRDLPRVA